MIWKMESWGSCWYNSHLSPKSKDQESGGISSNPNLMAWKLQCWDGVSLSLKARNKCSVQATWQGANHLPFCCVKLSALIQCPSKVVSAHQFPEPCWVLVLLFPTMKWTDSKGCVNERNLINLGLITLKGEKIGHKAEWQMEQWDLNSHQQRDAKWELLASVASLRSVTALAGLRAASLEVWCCRALKQWALEPENSYRNKSPFVADLWGLGGYGRNEPLCL